MPACFWDDDHTKPGGPKPSTDSENAKPEAEVTKDTQLASQQATPHPRPNKSTRSPSVVPTTPLSKGS